MATKPKRGGLVGKFFHSYDRETGLVVCWQGHILSEPSAGVYLAQLFSWIMGEPTDQLVIPISQMIDEHWKFYDTRDEWTFAYEHRYNADAATAKRGRVLAQKSARCNTSALPAPEPIMTKVVVASGEAVPEYDF